MKSILGAAVTTVLLSACGGNNTEIKGIVGGADKQTVLLEQVNVDRLVTVDSAKLNRKGAFAFGLTVAEPTLYLLRVGDKECVTLLVEPETEISVNGTYAGLSSNYTVEGSAGSALVRELNNRLATTNRTLDSLRKVAATLPDKESGDATRAAIVAAQDTAFEQQRRFSQDFILKNAISPAAYYALYQTLNDGRFILTPATDLLSYKIVASSMRVMAPESQYTKALLAHYDKIQKDLKALQMRQMVLNAGNDLPSIELPDIHGKNITLESLRGKYILLDFTVLAAEGSKAHNDELKAAYDKYRAKGLVIYQVCLDQNRLLWEELVERYQIGWTCVRDEQALKSYAAQIWNVQELPANYLISPAFDIVGKNLFGQRLLDRLADVVK